MGGPINHSQSFIFSGSYHFTAIGEWVGAGSFALGQVTVEKLSGQTKCVDLYLLVCFFFFLLILIVRFGYFFFYKVVSLSSMLKVVC